MALSSKTLPFCIPCAGTGQVGILQNTGAMYHRKSKIRDRGILLMISPPGTVDDDLGIRTKILKRKP